MAVNVSGYNGIAYKLLDMAHGILLNITVVFLLWTNVIHSLTKVYRIYRIFFSKL